MGVVPPTSESTVPDHGSAGSVVRPAGPQFAVPTVVVKESCVKPGPPVVVVVEDASVVVVVVPPPPRVVVVVPGSVVVVVDDAPGQTQPAWHSSVAPLGEPGGQVMLPGGSHSSPGSGWPFPQLSTIVVEEVEVTVVDVLVDPGASVVVVVVAWQPFLHESQQLFSVPTHAVPPFGATQSSALRFMEHHLRPFLSVRQQVTAFSRPQTELAAHATTFAAHPQRRSRALIAFFTTPMAQKTYLPWFVAESQSH